MHLEHQTLGCTRDFFKLLSKLFDIKQPIWLLKICISDSKLEHLTSYVYYVVEKV